MHAVLSGGLRPTAAHFFPRGGSSNSVLEREIADGHVYFTFHRPNCTISMSSTSSEEGRSGRPRRSIPPGDRSTKKPSELKEKAGGESSKSNQGQIIALFKRIQSSIAEGSDASKKRRPKSTRYKQPAESFLEEPQKYPTEKHVREQDSSRVPRLRNPLENKQEINTSELFTMSRPVSNFVKRSPIPSVTSAIEENDAAIVQNSTVMVPDKLELQKIDELKLPELKELAKLKGVKGYSKLKKKELAELLKELAQP